jgi:16S rRNA (cytosine1402-N4)-methyltransferase
MVREVVSLLDPGPGGLIGDLTLGGGGHAEALLEASSPTGRLLGIDRDPVALAAAKKRLKRFGERVTIAGGRFSRVRERMADLGIRGFDSIILDLGLSSIQLDDPDRGFSFLTPGPLDMRMDTETETTAAQLVNSLDRGELEGLIRELGEERFAGRIARRLVEKRPFYDTVSLASAVADVVPRGGKGRIHPATRVFQALRIAVNDELGELEALLGFLPEIMNPGGRAAIIAFHSLEDRLVKRGFQGWARSGDARMELITKKVLRPGDEEVRANPRARSARLRGIRKTAG